MFHLSAAECFTSSSLLLCFLFQQIYQMESLRNEWKSCRVRWWLMMFIRLMDASRLVPVHRFDSDISCRKRQNKIKNDTFCSSWWMKTPVMKPKRSLVKLPAPDEPNLKSPDCTNWSQQEEKESSRQEVELQCSKKTSAIFVRFWKDPSSFQRRSWDEGYSPLDGTKADTLNHEWL